MKKTDEINEIMKLNDKHREDMAKMEEIIGKQDARIKELEAELEKLKMTWVPLYAGQAH